MLNFAFADFGGAACKDPPLQRRLGVRSIGVILTEDDTRSLDRRVGRCEHRDDRRQRDLQGLKRDTAFNLSCRESHADLAGESRQAEVVGAGVGLGEVVLARQAFGSERRASDARRHE